jgi:50S ribosomal protein L16 3-hydroxylase
MLAQWLAPVDLSTFLQHTLQKQPYAQAGTAAVALPLLQWATLEKVLGSGRPLDVLTVCRGELVDVPRPRSLADVRRLMGVGVSVVVRASEQHDPGLADLARSFREALPGEVHIQLYATPGGSNSYGWHYDFEDVFIAQTAGIKDYFFRENTVAQGTVLGDRLDFTCFRQERTPLFSSRLEPGDWLYIPARWWHLVKCVEESLSISVGVMGPEALRSASRLPAGWSGSAEAAAPG